MTPGAPDLERVLADLDTMLREARRISDDAASALERIRRPYFPERRGLERRRVSDRRGTGDRRNSDAD